MRTALPCFALAAGLFGCSSTSAPSTSSGPADAPPVTTGAPAPSGVASDAKPCVKGGCSGTVCSETAGDMMTTCEFKPEYACYRTATCERQANGACGWTETPELASCLKSPPTE
jgi:hypothetical protein